MRLKKGHVLLLWVLLCSGGTGAIEPVSIASAVCLAAGFLAGYLPSHLHLNTFNIRNEKKGNTGLKTDLENKLFGQHLASRIILRAVNEFMSNDNPEKPLVLSLHGPPGTGKNFVSKLIAQNLYKEGMKSKNVHFFSPYHHFPRQIQISTYKSYLQKRIKSSVSNCERSMFIFDEMDKMHPGLIDSFRQHLDSYDELDGVSFRKSIFIFLSTAGEERIVQTALDFWKAGRDREEIDLKDIETSLYRSIFNDKSDFFRSTLIYKSLLTVFVPFLPLEYPHVVQCAVAEMKTRASEGEGPPDLDVANQIASDRLYFPKSERVFAVNGCKMIRQAVLLHARSHFMGNVESRLRDLEEAKDKHPTDESRNVQSGEAGQAVPHR
ncbi:hypothetical protein OJAV_G00122530 [Oryzias javanicus]|uniref:AAA+ ATPase domain-containing protein n=1 Tax=Oryzias javanicus TaxID=123683 RepID=A0A3S2MST9_ORYJA|nr:hypothetical protein OJAV_G00122530 [Oryzias javanicus]